LHRTNREHRPGRPQKRFGFASLLGALLMIACASSTLAAGTKTMVLPMLKPLLPANSPSGSQVAAGSLANLPLDRSSVTVRRGDTLMSALIRAGMPAGMTYGQLAAINRQIDARRLQIGDRLTLTFLTDGSRRRLAAVAWNGKRGASATVALLSGAAMAEARLADAAPAAVAPVDVPRSGAGMKVETMVVHGSPALPRVLTESGLPPQVCEQVIMALSQSRRPPVHGEIVKIVYQVPIDPANGSAPQLRYATFAGRDGKAHVFRYVALATPAALRPADLSPLALVSFWQPLPGARISSPYGWRVHPVWHKRAFHKGVDYEAALGTPVMASADGIVEDVGRRGNYGNYIRIRHSARLETAYAHLSGFAPALSAGEPVHRGDVIGYVGMTGVATGPHLYYELLVDGRQIDPESIALKQASYSHLPQTASVR
jgi:murein DD-endopeptidase MepM/ murein hydrolase activator NlpD